MDHVDGTVQLAFGPLAATDGAVPTFDPATLSWSPFDSTILFASVSSAGADTIVGTSFLSDWPPPDKLEMDASLPGGFTVNGHSRYADLRWLPRRTRLQY